MTTSRGSSSLYWTPRHDLALEPDDANISPVLASSDFQPRSEKNSNGRTLSILVIIRRPGTSLPDWWHKISFRRSLAPASLVNRQIGHSFGDRVSLPPGNRGGTVYQDICTMFSDFRLEYKTYWFKAAGAQCDNRLNCAISVLLDWLTD